jgi:hypothetical protein
MLMFLLAFLYADRPYYDHERVMCMAQYLINVQAKNRLEQKGLLKRFNINCYGSEKTLVDIRGEKAAKFKELKNAVDSKEYNKYFFKYIPAKNKRGKIINYNKELSALEEKQKQGSEDKDFSFKRTNKRRYYPNKAFKKTRKRNNNPVKRGIFDNIF